MQNEYRIVEIKNEKVKAILLKSTNDLELAIRHLNGARTLQNMKNTLHTGTLKIQERKITEWK